METILIRFIRNHWGTVEKKICDYIWRRSMVIICLVFVSNVQQLKRTGSTYKIGMPWYERYQGCLDMKWINAIVGHEFGMEKAAAELIKEEYNRYWGGERTKDLPYQLSITFLASDNRFVTPLPFFGDRLGRSLSSSKKWRPRDTWTLDSPGPPGAKMSNSTPFHCCWYWSGSGQSGWRHPIDLADQHPSPLTTTSPRG